MSQEIKKALGITLLEVLLVLAIAAMIIVMSIRYYQSASASEVVNNVMQEMQAITATADSLSASSGNYSTVTQTQMQDQLTNVNPFTFTAGQTSYNATIRANTSGGATGPMCTSLTSQVQNNPTLSNYRITGCGGGQVQYSYTQSQ